jgi:hypothetical protein
MIDTSAGEIFRLRLPTPLPLYRSVPKASARQIDVVK